MLDAQLFIGRRLDRLADVELDLAKLDLLIKQRRIAPHIGQRDTVDPPVAARGHRGIAEFRQHTFGLLPDGSRTIVSGDGQDES